MNHKIWEWGQQVPSRDPDDNWILSPHAYPALTMSLGCMVLTVTRQTDIFVFCQNTLSCLLLQNHNPCTLFHVSSDDGSANRNERSVLAGRPVLFRQYQITKWYLFNSDGSNWMALDAIMCADLQRIILVLAFKTLIQMHSFSHVNVKALRI